MTVASTLSSRLIDQEHRFGGRHDPSLGVVCTRADGVYLWDVAGNRYLDFISGHSAVNQGHCHTRIAAALVEQCLRLGLTSPALHHDRLPPLLEKLCTLTGYERALVVSTGAEAVETAIQAVRRWGYEDKQIPAGQAEVITFSGNSHGGSTTLLSCGPFTPGFRLVPFGDLGAVQAAIRPRTCAILVEPVQGEAGVIVPPKGFMKGLRDLCDQHRILLVADEAQCGLGRTGRFLACQHEGVKPDAVVLGNALSGGFYPVGALLASSALLDVLTPGTHGAPFDGNPLACAVASVALEVLTDEHLIDHSAELGAYCLERLRRLESPHLKEVRGLGLWAALELHPEAGGASRFCTALLQQGLLCQPARTDTLCLAPPLTITREQLDWAVDQLKVVLEA